MDGKPALDVGLELANGAWKLALTDGRRINPAVCKVDQSDLQLRLRELLQRLQDFKAR
jgi:hypothetical protein